MTNNDLRPEPRTLNPCRTFTSHATKNLRALATSRGLTEYWIFSFIFLHSLFV